MYFGPGISVGRRGVSYGDSDAQAFIAATGITGTTEVSAINKLVANLKTYGLWSKMKAIYPFVSDTKNLLSYSEDFSDFIWNKSAVTITTNQTTAPDGTNTADLIVPNTTSTNHILFQAPTSFTSSISYTFSYYAKSQLYTKAAIRIGGAGYGTVPRAEINLTNGSIIYQQGFTTLTVVNSGNGWYRICGTLIAASGLTPNIQPLSDSYSVVAENYVYAGDGTSGIYIWGAQLEQSASATTYQPIATTPSNRFVSQFKYNLKDPRDLDAAFRLAFNGTWTHSSTGALPNGANAYADTFLTPSANLTANSTHASYYSRTNVTTNAGTEIGTWSSGYNYGIELNLYRSVASQKTAAIINSGGGTAQINGGSVTPTTGLLIGSRTANNNGFVSKNGTTIGTNTTTVTTQLASFKVYLGAANNFGTAGAYSNKESAFASIGDGITEAEATTLNTLVTNFETTLNRNV